MTRCLLFIPSRLSTKLVLQPRRTSRNITCSLGRHHGDTHHGRHRPSSQITRPRTNAAAQLAACEARLRELRALRAALRERGRVRIAGPRPAWTPLLLAANVAFFTCARLMGRNTLAHLLGRSSPAILRGESHRLLTAALLHVSVAHLVANCIALHAVGCAVEILFGRAAFIAVYLSGAVVGNVLGFLVSPTSCTISIGCSGAVFALVGALVIHLHRNSSALGRRARDTLRSVVGAATCAVIVGFSCSRIDAWAHAGGLVAGMCTGMVLVPTVTRRGGLGCVRRAGKVLAVAVVAAVCVAAFVTVLSIRSRYSAVV